MSDKNAGGLDPARQIKGWLRFTEEPCPYCAVWVGPHEHSVMDDDTLGVVMRPVDEWEVS